MVPSTWSGQGPWPSRFDGPVRRLASLAAILVLPCATPCNRHPAGDAPASAVSVTVTAVQKPLPVQITATPAMWPGEFVDVVVTLAIDPPRSSCPRNPCRRDRTAGGRGHAPLARSLRRGRLARVPAAHAARNANRVSRSGVASGVRARYAPASPPSRVDDGASPPSAPRCLTPRHGVRVASRPGVWGSSSPCRSNGG
jgi:hypothetical protein